LGFFLACDLKKYDKITEAFAHDWGYVLEPRSPSAPSCHVITPVRSTAVESAEGIAKRDSTAYWTH